jgi:hypothetical protein
MDELSAENIRKISVGLANATLSLVGSGLLPRMGVLDIGNRDYIAEAFERALTELVTAIAD